MAHRRGRRAADAAAVAAGVIVAGLALACTGVFIAQATASELRRRGGATQTAASPSGCTPLFYYAGGSVGAALPAAVWSAGGWPACVALVIAVQAGDARDRAGVLGVHGVESG